MAEQLKFAVIHQGKVFLDAGEDSHISLTREDLLTLLDMLDSSRTPPKADILKKEILKEVSESS